MAQHEDIVNQPVFFLFIGISALLTFGYFWGRRRNRKIFLSAFNDLIAIVKPDDQHFTNIGGAIGFHANLIVKKKKAVLSRLDATITLLPRQSWLYLPVSKLTRKYDRLFISLYFKRQPPEEAHLIELGYSRFKGSKITNAASLKKKEIGWGGLKYCLYYQSPKIKEAMERFVSKNPDPGTVRHIAMVPEQKMGFVFMIPKYGTVADNFAPIFRWLPTVAGQK